MIRILTAILFTTVFLTASGVSQQSTPSDVKDVLAHFSKSAFAANMRFLSDDLLEGRGTGTRGQALAAKYVAAQFESFGLQPEGAHGSFFQDVPLREITADPNASAFALVRDGQTTTFNWADDFVTRSSEFQPDSSIEAPLVFVGFGVVNPGRQYDDYAGIDVKGKVAVMLPGAPPAFPANERAHFASGPEKARQAAAHGAIGIIRLWTPESDSLLPWARIRNQAESPGFRWLDSNGNPNDSYKEIRGGALVSVGLGKQLFAGSSESYDDMLKKANSGSLRSHPLPGTVRIHCVSKHREVSSPNVVAVLRGSDPALADEYVAYSAHTDHMGIGRPINGDRIYNGAVDDGSGTSALIELARAFAGMQKPPARSILFIATTGEEAGLLGADYFAHFPTVPRRNIVADLNMDGASVFYAFKDVIGDEHSTLGDTITQDAAKLGLSVSPDPMPEQVGFVRADHYPFVRQGIPAVTIAEGLQAKDPSVDGRKFVENWIATRYHAPSDDMNQPLNFDSSIQFLQLNFLVGYDIAQDQVRPSWKKGDFFGDLFGKGK